MKAIKLETLKKMAREGRVECTMQDPVPGRHCEIRWIRTGKRETIEVR